MIDRRGFLASLIAGAVLDPERLLWVPGQRVITFPKRNVFYAKTALFGLKAGDVVDCDFIAPQWRKHVSFVALAVSPPGNLMVDGFGQEGVFAMDAQAQRQPPSVVAWCRNTPSGWRDRYGESPWPNRFRNMAVGL